METSMMSMRRLVLCASASVAMLLTACTPKNDSATTTPAPVADRSVDNAQNAKIRQLEQAVRDAQKAAAEAKAAAEMRQQARPGGYTYTPTVAAGHTASAMAFPSGDPATSALLLHLIMPDEVNRNQNFEYQYHVTNTTSATLQDVVLSLESLLNLDIKSATPAAAANDGGVAWRLGDIGPRQTKIIKVQASASQLGMTTNCISIAYNNQLCAGTNVVEADLTLVKVAPRRVLRCDAMEFTYVVRNPGTGMAKNVRVSDRLPAGLKTADGQQTFNRTVGDLGPGESAEIKVAVEASTTGEFSSAATASATGLSADSDSTTTVIVQPALEITASCPETRYIGRAVSFEFKVKNVGDAEARDTIVTASVPAGSEYISASGNGAFANGNVVWQLGTLAAGQEVTVVSRVRANAAATLRSNGSVAAYCADAVTDDCITKVIGIPAVLLEVIDLEDPIEVGNTETYVIVVTNQGSAPDTNIQIVAILPDEQTYVSSSGSTRGSLSGQTITFAPLPSLAPKAKVEWRIVVRASKPGDVRFTVRMTSDELTTPVQENEATKLYE